MAVAVTTTNDRSNHQLIAVELGAAATWQVLTLPSWARGVEIINFGASDIYLSTDKADGASGTGGVKIASGASYSFRAGGADDAFIAARQGSGSAYEIGVALRTLGNS